MSDETRVKVVAELEELRKKLGTAEDASYQRERATKYHAEWQGALDEIDKLKAELAKLKETLLMTEDDRQSRIKSGLLYDDEIQRLRAQVEKLRPRRYPIMGGPNVPWAVMAPYEYQAKINHDQTLERLAERSGLGPEEAWAVVQGMSLRELQKFGFEAAKEQWRIYAEKVNQDWRREAEKG